MKALWKILTSKEFRKAVHDTIDIVDNPSDDLEADVIKIARIWKDFIMEYVYPSTPPPQ